MAKRKTVRMYEITSIGQTQSIADVLVSKLNECMERGEKLFVYVATRRIRKEAREFDRVRDTNQFGEPS